MDNAITEIWLPVKGYEGLYEVSDLGRIRSVPRVIDRRYMGKTDARQSYGGRVLIAYPNSHGYLHVGLWSKNKRQARIVHRLVAEAFLSGPSERTVNHKNGIKTDNRAANLEWATYSENHLHAVNTGLRKNCLPYTDPDTGMTYPSLMQACRALKRSYKTLRKQVA